MDDAVKQHLVRLQEEAQEVLSEFADLFPPNYRFTLVARNDHGVTDADIVLTNDNPDDAILAIQRIKDSLEEA